MQSRARQLIPELGQRLIWRTGTALRRRPRGRTVGDDGDGAAGVCRGRYGDGVRRGTMAFPRAAVVSIRPAASVPSGPLPLVQISKFFMQSSVGVSSLAGAGVVGSRWATGST